MARPLSFVVFAQGKRVHARLVKCPSSVAAHMHICPYCNRPSNMTPLCFMTQFSFFEDRHWHVYNCQQCEKNTAFQFDQKLRLDETVSRLV